MINKERKTFGLKGLARKPRKLHTLLSQTVAVHSADESGYCYIGFSEALVTFVGAQMPRGIARFDPCLLEVTEVGNGWLVEAVYYNDGVKVPLWEAVEKPQWIGKLRKGSTHEDQPHT